VLNHGKVTRNDTEKIEQNCDGLEVKKDLFCEEKLDTVLK